LVKRIIFFREGKKALIKKNIKGILCKYVKIMRNGASNTEGVIV